MIRIGIILFLLFPTALAWGGRARIEKIQVETIEEELLVSFELKDGFRGKSMGDIHDGIEKVFFYYVLLDKENRHWFDEEIVTRTLRYAVKYDTLKRVYSVVRKDGLHLEERSFDQSEAMQEFVTKIKQFPLAHRSVMEKDRQYFVRVKAQMKVSNVPLHVDRLLFFIPFLELDTHWARSWSIYPAEGP